jgi:hypothetical protein
MRSFLEKTIPSFKKVFSRNQNQGASLKYSEYGHKEGFLSRLQSFFTFTNGNKKISVIDREGSSVPRREFLLLSQFDSLYEIEQKKIELCLIKEVILEAKLHEMNTRDEVLQEITTVRKEMASNYRRMIYSLEAYYANVNNEASLIVEWYSAHSKDGENNVFDVGELQRKKKELKLLRKLLLTISLRKESAINELKRLMRRMEDCEKKMKRARGIL